jgi:galactonate dehydratase
MIVTRIDDLHADSGWRTLSFLKITTDEGIVGWSEFSASASAPGLRSVIRELAASVVGFDPRQVNRLVAGLMAKTRMFPSGLVAQAIAAIENACLDIHAKSLGVPVHALFGGVCRDRLPVYWSQCGTLRTRHAELFGAAPLRSLDDVVTLGQEVRTRGFNALKTNILLFDGEAGSNYRPGFGFGPEHPALNLDGSTLAAMVDLLSAFRQGAGPDVRLMIDLNFNFRPDGATRVARALEPFDLLWLEYDTRDPQALAAMRCATSTPIASLEAVLGRQALRPFLDAGAVDVAIIDPQWNGLSESLKMASMAESYEINVASHNYHGQLSTLIGAHFSAIIPNNRIVELVVDEVPWVREFYTTQLHIDQGELVLPLTPGWGTDINEEAVRARPASLS